jgi:hypothetical protein
MIRQHVGVLERPAFVIVQRDDRTFPGVLFEWRRRRHADGFMRWSGRVIYLDGEKVLRQSWFLERFVEPSPIVRPT